MKLIFAVAICIFAFGASAGAQQSSSEKKAESQNSQAICPMHDANSQMNERGEKGMGFPQTATTHNFLLKTNGGAIRVEVNDPANADGRNSVRMHLTHIAKAFQKGDFDIPMFVHDTVPPGVPEMKRLRGNIEYSVDETPNGGQVVIFSTDRAALLAIHQFLRFQIEEHKTGDPTEIR
jgi:hypothetical protein